jgi:apolipoprotein D and lipocalin family protein
MDREGFVAIYRSVVRAFTWSELPYLPEMKLLPTISPKQTKLLMACCISLFIAMFLFQKSHAQELQTVPEVDLNRYAGKWFEIASYPQRFQQGCNCTTAEYTLSEKGYVVVENRCNKGAANGPVSYIKGKAFVTKNSGNAKLKVQFFWPFRASYWIIDLAPDYSYAVVSHPSRQYLWILSRTPVMDENTYTAILQRLTAKGFDLNKLNKTVQVEM